MALMSKQTLNKVQFVSFFFLTEFSFDNVCEADSSEE